MPTIKDVAKLAGVSIATVSNVLSGGRYVSPELRGAVLGAVRSLGYVPNGVAQSLRSRRTRTLGLLIPEITNPFFSGLVKAIERSARERGYQVLLSSSEENPDLEFDLTLSLASRQVDGLIVIPTHDSPEYLGRLGLPVVLLDRIGGTERFDRVGVDNVGAARIGTEFLLSQGHRRILLLASTLELSNIRERVEGYKQALEGVNLKYDPELVVACGREASAVRVALEAIQKHRPTALFAATNRISLLAVQAIRELGLAFPQQISLLGFDDFEWSTLLEPYLTTVVQPLEALGATACGLLLERLREPSRPPQTVLLPCDLAVRQSVARP
ncbi:MAG: LacI family transcriptional regulator [Meiothermus sp.]